jgi:hypothetical protein
MPPLIIFSGSVLAPELSKKSPSSLAIGSFPKIDGELRANHTPPQRQLCVAFSRSGRSLPKDRAKKILWCLD